MSYVDFKKWPCRPVELKGHTESVFIIIHYNRHATANTEQNDH